MSALAQVQRVSLASRTHRLLLIEDDSEDALLICEMLKEAAGGQFPVKHCNQLAAGLRELKTSSWDVVILDLNLPDSEGFETFARLHAEFPHLPVIVLTGVRDTELALRAVSEGAQDYLTKGDISGSVLVRVLRHGIERKRAEQRFRLLLEAAPLGIIISGQEGGITDVNAQALRMFGYERRELIGQKIEILLPEHLRNRHAMQRTEFMKQPRVRLMGTGMELSARRKDGSQFPAEISLGPLVTQDEVLVSSTVVDITARKKIEEQLRVAQRMEAIGRLAGGVAHDFNNLLGVILSCSEALLEELPAGHPALRKIEIMKKAGSSAADLTRQLLAFGRKQVLCPRVFEPGEVVSGVGSMLSRLIGENIALEVKVYPAVGCINADPGQVEQILVNLAVNARDAMPNGGRLTIEVANADLDDAYKKQHPPVIAGPYVMIAVSDTGSGIDPAIQSRIFDPFFTTKELGKGTGLGLATVYGVVKQSGGYIWVYSEVGKGTVFKVYLPRVARIGQPVAAIDPDLPAPHGSETILFAEDSEALGEIATEYLRSLGYTVIEAGTGKQALERADEFQGRIDMLLTDVVMPEMSGRELADHLILKRPDIKVLFTSGYTDDTIVCHGVLEPGVAFIQKPYRPKALARKIREILGPAAGSRETADSPPLYKHHNAR